MVSMALSIMLFDTDTFPKIRFRYSLIPENPIVIPDFFIAIHILWYWYISNVIVLDRKIRKFDTVLIAV